MQNSTEYIVPPSTWSVSLYHLTCIIAGTTQSVMCVLQGCSVSMTVHLYTPSWTPSRLFAQPSIMHYIATPHHSVFCSVTRLAGDINGQQAANKFSRDHYELLLLIYLAAIPTWSLLLYCSTAFMIIQHYDANKKKHFLVLYIVLFESFCLTHTAVSFV